MGIGKDLSVALKAPQKAGDQDEQRADQSLKDEESVEEESDPSSDDASGRCKISQMAKRRHKFLS